MELKNMSGNYRIGIRLILWRALTAHTTSFTDLLKTLHFIRF